jgi:hypothetical protein
LRYQDATGLAAGTGRLTMGVEIVPSPNEADTCTELFGLKIVLDIREIGPYLLTIGGSNGINSSSAMTESDLYKVQSTNLLTAITAEILVLSMQRKMS